MKFKRIPRALSTLVSKSGEAIAFLTASTAALSPEASPTPISAEPALFIIDCTSAKSRLMTPGTAIKSEMPLTPCRKISSAIANALVIGVFLSTTCNSLSLGIVIIASTFFFSLSMPKSAFLLRLGPSKAKGRVTTATVSALTSRAHSATTGAAPVPVPPPMPAVINTMSEPRRASKISLRLSCAARSPISGRAPQPNPRVSFSPICILFGDLLISNA